MTQLLYDSFTEFSDIKTLLNYKQAYRAKVCLDKQQQQINLSAKR